MPVAQFLDTLKVLGGLLATLYGVENAATALKGSTGTTVLHLDAPNGEPKGFTEALKALGADSVAPPRDP